MSSKLVLMTESTKLHQSQQGTRSFLGVLGKHGDADAVVFNGETTSYQMLLRQVNEWREYLDQHGISAGQVVVLEAAYSPAACAALLALIDAGAIVVPLTTLPKAKRTEFHEIAEVEKVVTIDGLGSGRHVTETGGLATHELYAALRAGPTPGLVLFSSGTSGRSKASVLDIAKALARYSGKGRAARTLSFLNLDHIGGINTLLHTFTHGGAIITVPERTPDSVFAAIAAHRVEVLPTTPTFLTMALVSGAYQQHDTSSLKLITYGTEPMPAQTLSSLRAALPAVRLKQTYGLSELGILPTKSKSDDSLWVKLGDAGFAYKIIDDVLWVRSEMAMLGYLNAPAPFDDEGYFNTQDVVERSGEYIRILGRRTEIINVGGEKVYPSEVENVILEASNVAEVIVSGRRSPVTGMVVQAKVRLMEPEDERAAAERIRAHCRARLEPYKVPALLTFSDSPQYSDRFKKMRSTE